MHRRIPLVALVALLIPLPAIAQSPPAALHLSADRNWRFSLGDHPGAQAPDFNDADWRTLSVPHDWSIELPVDQNAPAGGAGGYFPGGIGWYRRHFTTPDAWRNKHVRIDFDGVYFHSEVFLNGQSLGKRPSGYASFAYDLDKFLAPPGKENVLAVRVDNSIQPNTRWYSGSGILRHVWIDVSGPARIAHWGTFVRTSALTSDKADVQVDTTLESDSSSQATLALSIIDPAGKTIATAQTHPSLTPGTPSSTSQTLSIPQPQRWSLESPALYTLRTQLLVDNQPVDATDTPLGLRTIAFDVDKGFLLNGQQVKIKGVCLHADGGAFGGAVPEDVWERRLTLLKEMGANAVRCSHNPPAPEFLDLCDRLGILVMDEAFDEWTSRKGQLRGDYTGDFQEWSQRDLETMLLRDRNHPSIILWSVGNEIPEQTRPNGVELLKPLVDTCHRLDPTRPVTSACDNAYAVPRATLPEFFALLDVAGYNYVDRWNVHRETMFDDHRRQFPERKFIGTEDVSVGGIRGDYSAPVFAGRGGRGAGGAGRGAPGRGAPAPASAPAIVEPPGTPPRSQRPAYAPSAIRYEQLWKYFATRDYVTGDFIWTGIDYLGETGWPRKGATSGPLDICGFKKDGFYFFQSIWLPEPLADQKPMIHLLPHWNWKGREGQVIPVIAYTNASTVELFLNGKSFGVKAREFPRQGTSTGWNTYAKPQVQPTTADLHLEWDIPYEPGALMAVARSATGAVAIEELHTTGEPAALEFQVDKTDLPAHTGGIIHAAVRVVDANGLTVPTANSPITFTTDVPVPLRVDNGDLANHDLYTNPTRPAFNGWCMAFLQPPDQPGATATVTLTATAPGLKPATQTFTLHSPQPPALP